MQVVRKIEELTLSFLRDLVCPSPTISSLTMVREPLLCTYTLIKVKLMLRARHAVQARRHNGLTAYDEGEASQDDTPKARHLSKYKGRSARSFTRGILTSLTCRG